MQQKEETIATYENFIEELLEESTELLKRNHRLQEECNQQIRAREAMQNELNSVYGSLKWRFSIKIARWVHVFFPLNSRRRAFVKKIYYFLRRKKAVVNQEQKPEVQAPKQMLLLHRPKISIVMPVYNVKECFLREAIESVLSQIYDNWELCIVDDASTQSHVRPVLEEYAAKDPRIKVKFSKLNQYISAASNKAMKMSTGQYIAFLDNDDMLCPDTLLLCVDWLNKHNDTDLLYTDNYTVDVDNNILGKMRKPDWSPEFYLSTNYIVHFCVYSAKLFKQLGGLNEEDRFKGAQDIEIKGRLSRITNKIGHLPVCLYKWRLHQGSVSAGIKEKASTLDNSVTTFQDILDNNYKFSLGRVVMPVEAQNAGSGYFTVIFPKELKKTLIIIPVPLESMRNQKLLDLLAKFSKENPIKVVLACRCISSNRKETFYKITGQNQSAICKTVRESGADQVVMLSNQIDRISLESIRNVCGFATLSKEIGACGGKILSKEMKILEGAYLLMNHLQIMHGGLDRAVTYQEQCTQNCSAVTGGLMAVSAKTFLKYRGPDFQRFGELADVDFCLRMRKNGLRIVYNPRAEGRTGLPFENIMLNRYSTKAYLRLYEKYINLWGRDPYYNPSYSQDMQFLE